MMPAVFDGLLGSIPGLRPPVGKHWAWWLLWLPWAAFWIAILGLGAYILIQQLL